VYGARGTKSLTISRRKKARTFADTKGKYLTPDEETEADHTRRKLIKRMLPLASTRSYAEVLTLREFNTAEAWIIREQNGRCLAEQRAKMTMEESILDQVINATHQRASRKRRALQFVWTATGELEVF